MKLIYCPDCSDLFNLVVGKKRVCSCGASHGSYTNNLEATYGGTAIPIGINNSDFNVALYNYQTKRLTREELDFKAFFVVKSSNTFKHE